MEAWLMREYHRTENLLVTEIVETHFVTHAGRICEEHGNLRVTLCDDEEIEGASVSTPCVVCVLPLACARELHDLMEHVLEEVAHHTPSV
jgi:hypothetical protein